LVRSAPIIAVLFAVPALSLAGLPPFSGFLAKFSLVDAGLGNDAALMVAVSLIVGLLTLYSMTKIWSGVFWGEPEEKPVREPQGHERLGGPIWMVLPTALLAVWSLAFSFWAGPMYDFAVRAAEDLLSPSLYRAIITKGG
jgi:multicomponent Na+:H+ antiporter subunit D